jgi:hypothetical protein
VSSSVSPSASLESSVERRLEICEDVLVTRLEYHDAMAVAVAVPCRGGSSLSIQAGPLKVDGPRPGCSVSSAARGSVVGEQDEGCRAGGIGPRCCGVEGIRSLVGMYKALETKWLCVYVSAGNKG